MKKCIITGGNSGIGYQAAKQLDRADKDRDINTEIQAVFTEYKGD